jgi:hypothetical protein
MGIQRMVAIRGGLDKLGLDGYVKNCILYIDGLGLASERSSADAETPAATESSMPTIPTESSSPSDTASEAPLRYPSHPFPPDLCELVAKIPPGFIDLAMYGYLSVELIPVIERLLHYASQATVPLLEFGPGDHLYDLKRLARRLPAPTQTRSKRNVEQLVCLAFMMLSIEMFTGIKTSRLNLAQWRLVRALCLEDYSARGKVDVEGKLECELKAWFIIMAAQAGSEDESAHHIEGQKISEVLMDRLLSEEASGNSPTSSRPEFPYARRWRGPRGLRVVLAKFFIDDRLDREWRTHWRTHMTRKGIPIQPVDEVEEPEPPREVDDDNDEELHERERARLLRSVRERSRLLYVDEQESLGPGETFRPEQYHHQPSHGTQIELSLEDDV